MAVLAYSSNRSVGSRRPLRLLSGCEIQAHTPQGEDITITVTDTDIIPLKEPVVDHAYDPLGRLIRTFTGAA